jgi:uncharacterized protein HemX
MNAKKQTSIAITDLSMIAIISALILGLTNSPTWGQQQQNTPNATTITMANQTTAGVGGGGGALANLTSQDFELLQDSLNEARGAIHDNETTAALEALNNTETQLSELDSPEPAEEEGEEDESGEREDDTTSAEDPEPLIVTPN